MKQKRVVIAGGGAAGLTAAWFAAKAGAEVIILERNDRAGNKIVMSGGSRCNLLPMVMKEDDYFTSGSRRSLGNVFKSWNLDACKTWFEEEIGLDLLAETETNKWFPSSQSGKEVRDTLVRNLVRVGVSFRYESPLEDVKQKDGRLELRCGGLLETDAVIISTGGYSIPTSGTDGSGHLLLDKLGHTTGPVYPALTPLKGAHPAGEQLAGISLLVESSVWEGEKCVAKANRAGFVFTHRGFSGPAILDISHYLIHPQQSGAKIRINWASKPESEWERVLQPSKALVSTRIAEFLPERLAEALASEAGLAGVKTAEMSREKRKIILQKLTSYELPITGHEGYKKAEVTGGGVPLSEINTANMESRIIPGVFLCGEILDVFGRIGGFNFYWAWVSGRLAGMKAGEVIS